jgi:hypothetical protein
MNSTEIAHAPAESSPDGGLGIPKRIIHLYCAPPGSPNDLPLLYRAAIASATLLNPDFEHRLFDTEKFEAFLADEPLEYRQAMKSFRYPIQRFDFFRYLVIYRLGGIYLDLDVILARGLAPLLSSGCVFPFEELTLSGHLRKQHGIDWEIGNYAFGAAARHPFIKAIIENCVRAQQDPEWASPMLRGIPGPLQKQFFVVNTTGPGLVSRTLAENPGLRETVTVLFPEDICNERSWHRFGDYGIHLMNASWRPRDGVLLKRVARLWESRLRRKQLQESLARGPVRPGAWRSSFPASSIPW